jgi:hypothetical protein
MANRISQVPIEIVIIPNPHARISQVVSESVYSPNPHARLSQVALETIIPYVRPVVATILEFQNP